MYSSNASEIKLQKLLPILCVNKCNKILKLQHPSIFFFFQKLYLQNLPKRDTPPNKKIFLIQDYYINEKVILKK